MIEKRFKDPTGFSDKNTFFQFDQWETQNLLGAKNRFVYDFSWPILDGQPDDYLFNYERGFNTGDYPYQRMVLSNLSPAVLVSPPGRPGGYAEFKGNFGSARTINENEACIYTNGDLFGFTNQKIGLQDAEYVDYFRAGYAEFTIKTDKQNCIIASGSSEIDAEDLNVLFWTFGASMEQGADISALSKGDTMAPIGLTSEQYPYYRADSFDGALINLNIRIINGKLAIEYYDDYNRDDVNFLFVGNENIADNQWHHIVVNFGRPGLIKTNGVKFNKKFVEIWVDGSLDKRFDDKVNEYQIFYPTIKWLFNNPKDIVYNVLQNELDLETNFDIKRSVQKTDFSGTYFGLENGFGVGFSEITDGGKIFDLAVASDFFQTNSYKGALHLFAHGVNIPISQYEIKRRLRLWKKETKKFATIVDVNANMVMPTISTNSKKSLRLFWPNLIDNGKFGVELDNNYQNETYCITHILNNSPSDVLNYDSKLDKKELNILPDVRVVLTDDVLVNGPGMVFFPNTEEARIYIHGKGQSASALQKNPKGRGLDSVDNADLNEGLARFVGPRSDLVFSGIELNSGDRILLTGQIRTEENGLWIFNGLNNYLSRAEDSLIEDDTKINVVYVSDGYNKGSYWRLDKAITSLLDTQKWLKINLSDIDNFFADFEITKRWKDYRGEDRFIDINSDLDISKYDVVTFVNYPERNEQIYEMFPNDPELEITKKYKEFIDSINLAASSGANIFVSSPKLAEDMGIVKKFTLIDQEIENSDGRSAVINPFEFNEPAERYFDTHRQNAYHLNLTVPGLTDHETWIMTEAINYLPQNKYDNEQWHLKYSYRQFGLQEGDEFLIPSLSITSFANNDDLPGYRSNSRSTKSIYAVAPQDLLTGTALTGFANNHYHGDQIAANEYDDYVTSIIIHNGQLLGNYPINGKIFVNCIEDSYTMSREEYNRGTIQIVPAEDANETIATRAWQYSTSRLNREPQTTNVKSLTSFGQTTPTNGGGGAIVQSQTNSGNGIIRSETDRNNIDYQSDLYPTESEEIYPIQTIPVLSMTWLGLKWLEG